MKKDDHQKGHSRKNTANIGGAAYAPQQDEPHSKGDERAPNKPIGEVAYQPRPDQKEDWEVLRVQNINLPSVAPVYLIMRLAIRLGASKRTHKVPALRP